MYIQSWQRQVDKDEQSESKCWAYKAGEIEMADRKLNKSIMRRVFEVLSNTKQKRLRQWRQVNNEQSDSRCWANESIWIIEKEASLQWPERLEMLRKQSKKDSDRGKFTTNRAIWCVKHNKARFKIETKTISRYNEKCNVWGLWGRLLLNW